MNFDSAKEEADKWTKSRSIPFRLVGTVDEERRLIFESQQLSLSRASKDKDTDVHAPVSKVPDDESASSSLTDQTNVLRTCSFYVICPSCSDNVDEKNSTGSTTDWHVWSDDENILPRLTAVQDFIHTCREKNLTGILDKVFISLKKYMSTPPGASVHPSDDNDDEDPGFDDVGDDDVISDDDEIGRVDDDAGEGMQILPQQPGSAGAEEAGSFFVGHASQMSVHRILKDLKQLQEDACKDYGIEGSPRGDNLFVWDVRLSNFPTDSILGKDLQRYAERYTRDPVISLEMRFPDDYPMSPPFVRVIRPKFQFQTGHITVGGSICMEMLTTSGWTPTNDIEGILVQIRAEIMSDPSTCLDPRSPDKEYSELEARQAFQRMVQRYGWK